MNAGSLAECCVVSWVRSRSRSRVRSWTWVVRRHAGWSARCRRRRAHRSRMTYWQRWFGAAYRQPTLRTRSGLRCRGCATRSGRTGVITSNAHRPVIYLPFRSIRPITVNSQCWSTKALGSSPMVTPIARSTHWSRLSHYGGDTTRAVAALSEAVTEAPYRERRWELLALGLYRSGRQGHALAELRRARNLFIDELGVDPGPTLSTLERRILEHDPDLLLVETPAGRVSAGTASPTPLRINQPLALLIGRRRELETLDELLATRRLVTIVGPAGVGKTRLALEHAASRPDAWLVRLADVHSADVIASTVASAIGLSQFVGDTELAIRRAVADRSAVLVLDNCEHLVAAVAAFA